VSEYDYIVVGAGSAGCAIAARLSEDADRRVLLLEAGGDDTSVENIHVPSAWPALWGTEVDWAYDLSREAQDRFALSSHQKAVRAMDEKRFREEIVPVTVKTRKGETVVEADEGPRRDTSLEKLSTLKPAFSQGGSVTAGNSSSLNDGAAAVMVVSEGYARAHGLEPLAKVRSIGVAGVPPRVMGIGPVPATRKALERVGISMDDLGLVELNEAFAAQVLACLHEWGMDAEDERLNPNGGAIALGHPLGASGARILTTLVHEMGRREEVRYGLATMCIGVGQGIAMVVEKVE
jgi:acetyl-CoA acyltransferase